MRIAGIVLIIFGIIGFIIGGITVTETQEVVDLGVMEIQRQEEQTFPFTPWASGAALIVGIGLIGLDIASKKDGGTT